MRYLSSPIIFYCGNRGSIEISSTLGMISSYSNRQKLDLFPFMLICDMPRFLSSGPVQIVHICERCAMIIFTQITHFTAKFFSGGKNKVLYLLHTPFFYVGIHNKIQANFIGQDIKKNTVRNYRTDIGTYQRDVK